MSLFFTDFSRIQFSNVTGPSLPRRQRVRIDGFVGTDTGDEIRLTAPNLAGSLFSTLASRDGAVDGEETSISGVPRVGVGPGRFRFYLGDVGPTVYGLCQVAGAGAWRRVLDSYVTPEMFGADPGVATAVANTAAINIACSLGYEVRFAANATYEVTVPAADDAIKITSKNGVRLIGSNTIIKMANGVSSAGATRVINVYDCDDFYAEGITFDGNRLNRVPTTVGQAVLWIFGGARHDWVNVKAINSNSDGWEMYPINDNDLSTYPTDIRITDCGASGCYMNGGAIIGGRRITISGGDYSNNAGFGDPESGWDLESNPAQIYGIEDVTINGVTVRGNAGPGIIIAGTAPVPTAISGVGNGTVSSMSVYGPTKVSTPADPYILECIATAAHGGTFRLTDPDGVVLSSSLVLTSGAGVATRFRVGGLQFDITDGSTDFGVGKIFHITCTQTHARDVKISGLRGTGNARCLLQCAVGWGIQVDGLLSVGETATPTQHALVTVSNICHGVTVNGMSVRGSRFNDDEKALLYFDNGGIGHSVNGFYAGDFNCKALTAVSPIVANNITVEDQVDSAEAAVSLSANGVMLTNLVGRRCSSAVLRADAATGTVVRGVTIQQLPLLAQGIFINAPGIDLQGVDIFHEGDDPHVAFSAVYALYFGDAATPRRVLDVRGKATGTDFTKDSLVRLPTARSGYEFKNVIPSPFTSAAGTRVGSAIAGGARSTSIAVSIPGARVNDTVKITTASHIGGLVPSGVVSADDAVDINFFNQTAGSLGASDIIYTCVVEKS